MAKCFELMINAGSTAVWAERERRSADDHGAGDGGGGERMRSLVDDGRARRSRRRRAATTLIGGRGRDMADGSGGVAADESGGAGLERGAIFAALKGYGIDVAAAFSMELQHGDDSLEAGIAQRYPDGIRCWLNTPALQTNFSAGRARRSGSRCMLDMAEVMAEAGVRPYLQFGEVQWWYFRERPSGMPFYDDYTTSHVPGGVRAADGGDRERARGSGAVSGRVRVPAGLIGEFTDAMMAFVRRDAIRTTRFEVLYPPDVNDTPLNRLINLPRDSGRRPKLDCLKTENFTYTGDRNLDKARESIVLPMRAGVSAGAEQPPGGDRRVHDAVAARSSGWRMGEGLESVVLFALDQFCLIGYELPLDRGSRRALFMGA